MHVDIRHLRSFVAVAEELNFRRAAEKLNIAQPALSRAIRDLETIINVRLFDRSTRSVLMTPAAEQFLPEARDLLAHLAAAVNLAQRIDSGDAGTLSVGFNDFAINDFLPGIIMEFRTRYPDIKINLRSMTSPDMAEGLAKGRLDIGFLSGSHLVSRLKSEITCQDRLVCLLPRGHRLAERSAIDVADLRDEAFVMGVAGSWDIFLGVVNAFCLSAGFAPAVVQEATHSDGIVNLVAAGVGVSIYVDAHWLSHRRDVVALPFVKQTPKITNVVAWNPDYQSRMIESFLGVTREFVPRPD